MPNTNNSAKVLEYIDQFIQQQEDLILRLRLRGISSLLSVSNTGAYLQVPASRLALVLPALPHRYGEAG